MGWIVEASTSAGGADRVFLVSLGISVFFLLFITALMIYFVIRYSKERHPKAENIEGNTWLEITWTLVPLVVFLAIFYYGWTNFDYTRNPPRNAMVVNVLGRQWNWSFQYPNGKVTSVLYAALEKPMRLDIRSADVIHGFFVPAFRLKMDAVPGHVNTTWFQPTQLGAYDIECTVICGVDHSYMLSKVVVVPVKDFETWYFGGDDAPEPGKALVAANSPALNSAGSSGAEAPGLAVLKAKNCLVCHSIDGKPMVGPTLKGLYGSTETVVSGGITSTVKVDDAYIQRAIKDPAASIVKGYPPTMPPATLSAAELAEVLGYLKSLR